MNLEEMLYIAAVDDNCEYGDYKLVKRMVKEANRWTKCENCTEAFQMVKHSLNCAGIKHRLIHFRGKDAICATFKGGEITVTHHSAR